MLKLMTKHARGYKLPTILTPLFVMVEVFLEIFIPTLMANIVNSLQETPLPDDIVNIVVTNGLLMVASAVASLVFGALAGRTSSIASTGFAKNLRAELFEKIQQFSFANVDKFSTASLVTRCTTDVNNAQTAFMQLTRVVFRAPTMLIMATIMAFRLNPDLSVIFFVAIPLLGIAMAVLVVKVHPMFRKMLKCYDHMNATVQEDLVAIRVVKAFVREEHEIEKYRDATEGVRVSQLAAEKTMVLINPIANIVMYGTTIALLFVGGGEIIDGHMKAGDLTALMTYSAQILMSVMMICFISVSLVLSRASLQRINEVLLEEPDIKDGAGDFEVEDGSIDFDNVNFSYSNNAENLTLENINLHIKPGQMVGVIGGTGDGKSSLVQLIPRLYDVLEGSVKVGGRDVRDYNLHNLREGVSMVLQKNVLFSGTIKENMLWGNENATDEEIIAACKVAQAHDFVSSFPDGYETDLGQGGVNVSGGQKQRLCIARALLKKPKIMIMDDSTSAVDTATDAAIRSALRSEVGHMTTIIIAQRISSVQDCDMIVVMNDGKINDIGTHEQLLERNTIYQEIFNSQQKGVAEQ
ncbi:MAG TPA: ABC transporter ATP-binding protein [Candidatus Limihabitans stercoravium]|nr:ABC transporter ATP-binding protein [Candidatus Limihabitans stercoravium]